MKKFLLTYIFVAIATFVFSQTADQYSFSASSGSFLAVNGTDVDVIEVDEAISAAIPIGFTFNYCGTDYTQVKASSNGWLTFDITETSSQLTNDLDGSSYTPQDLLAPLWDDLEGNSSSPFKSVAQYKTDGVAPNRTFTMSWVKWIWDYAASDDVISFEIILYESDNHIEFRYDQETDPPYSADASIGIQDAAGNFQSLNGTGTSPTPSSITETTTLSTRPANGQIYSWTPPISCTAPTTQASSFTSSAITDNTMTVGWTRGNGNNVMVVARAGSAPTDPTSGTSYTANAAYGSGDACGGGFVVYNGPGTSVNLTALSMGTTYYFAIYEYYTTDVCYFLTELTGSATTTGASPYCIPSNTYSTSYYVDDFSTTGGSTNITNNNSGFSTNGYGDFTSMTVTQIIGNTVNFSITSGNGTMGYAIWVDWNQDGDFSDTGEQVFVTSSGIYLQLVVLLYQQEHQLEVQE